MTIDIHHFERQYQQALANLARLPISERNKEFVRSYCDACLLRQACGKVRLIRVIVIMGLLARSISKDFDELTRQDVERLLGDLLRRNPPYSVETISTYKKVLRRFLTFVFRPDEFPHVKQVPECVAWMTGHIKKRDRTMIKRSDLLTPSDVEQLLRSTTSTRDRAFVAIIWEAGARIGEIGNMQVRHISRTTNGYTIDISGKTGSRTPLLISSAPYISAWLANHPRANDPDAPLWVQRNKQPLSYDAFVRTLQRLFHTAGITKPCNPHIFRHSRVTYVLANGIMNEQQAKVYFGWAADSDMPGATYAHLIDTDVNNAILRENNLAPHQQVQRELQPVTCRICGQLNQPRAEYCQSCAAVLDLKKAYEHQQLHDLKEDLFAKMFKLLVEKGMIDEAAREIHDAGLGSTLKRLAQHVTGERNIADTTVNQNPPVVKQNNVV